MLSRVRWLQGCLVAIVAVAGAAGAVLSDGAPVQRADAAVQPCDTTPDMGVTYACTIDFSSELDVFSIFVPAGGGGRFFARAVNTAGGNEQVNLSVHLSLFSPALCSATHPAAEVHCLLDSSTSYVIVVSKPAPDVGGYSLYFQHKALPANAEPLTLGVAQTDDVDAGGARAYTFAGDFGDKLLLRARSLTAGFNPQARIFDPANGTVVCEASGATFDDVVCTLGATATYTLLVHDLSGPDGGTVATWLQRTKLSGADPLTLGNTVTGNLAEAEMDTFTYTAPGNTLILRAVRTGGEYAPEVRVYGPLGLLLCSFSGGLTVSESTCLLGTGEHTIVVGAAAGEAGDYAFFTQDFAAPVARRPRFGEIWREPGAHAHLATLVANLNIGESIHIRATRLSGAAQPEIRVFSPGGVLECSTFDAFSAERFCTTTFGGQHVILVGDRFGDDASSYSIQYRHTEGPGLATAMVRGTARTGSLLRVGESALYEFTGAIGDQYTATVTENEGQLEPSITFLRPNGEPDCTGEGEGPVVGVACALNVAGTWRVLVRDFSGANTGAYDFGLSCSNCTASTDADADGVPDSFDNCATIPNPSQTNSDFAPLDIPGAAFDDHTRANSDTVGDPCDPDDDNDGLPDVAEINTGCGIWGGAGVPLASTAPDTDGDRSSDLYECMVGTNPNDVASKPALAGLGGADNDQLPDDLEAFFASDFESFDSDGDGVQDGLEVRGYFSSPAMPDGDGDQCPDDVEIPSINADTVVNAIDLGQVAQRFFMTNQPVFDVNRDGTVSSLDLLLQAQNFILSECEN